MAAPPQTYQCLTLAQEAIRSNRPGAAAKILTEGLARFPDDVQLLEMLGYVRFFQGRLPECESLNRRALALEPDRAYALKGLGMALAKQGKIDEGIASLRAAVAANPGEGDHYWDLAVVLKDAGRHDECRHVIHQALKNATPPWHPRFEKLQSLMDK